MPQPTWPNHDEPLREYLEQLCRQLIYTHVEMPSFPIEGLIEDIEYSNYEGNQLVAQASLLIVDKPFMAVFIADASWFNHGFRGDGGNFGPILGTITLLVDEEPGGEAQFVWDGEQWVDEV